MQRLLEIQNIDNSSIRNCSGSRGPTHMEAFNSLTPQGGVLAVKKSKDRQGSLTGAKSFE